LGRVFYLFHISSSTSLPLDQPIYTLQQTITPSQHRKHA
jgi:hypothetical protein